MTKPRIFRAKDGCGILFAGEDPKGKSYIMYHSTVTRKKRRADLDYHGNRRHEKWEDAQADLNEVADILHLTELPLSIGGEI